MSTIIANTVITHNISNARSIVQDSTSNYDVVSSFGSTISSSLDLMLTLVGSIGMKNLIYYTSNSTYTVSNGVNSIIVVTTASGSGGSQNTLGSTDNVAYSGGPAGGTVISYEYVGNKTGNVADIIVGIGGSPANTGMNSRFILDSIVIDAYPGYSTSNVKIEQPGQSGANGKLRLTGGSGRPGGLAGSLLGGPGGTGGSSFWGGGSSGSKAANTSTTGANTAKPYGAGGGGGNGAGSSGGYGANGIVVVIEL